MSIDGKYLTACTVPVVSLVERQPSVPDRQSKPAESSLNESRPSHRARPQEKAPGQPTKRHDRRVQQIATGSLAECKAQRRRLACTFSLPTHSRFLKRPCPQPTRGAAARSLQWVMSLTTTRCKNTDPIRPPHRAGIHRRSLCLAGAATLVGCAAKSGPPAAAAAAAELGATGKLRAAINFGNPILASRDGSSARGVSVDLAREAARRLGLPVELVLFNSAGDVVEAVKDGQVDLAFVAIDPVRAADMEYTAAYVIIEGAYLVRQDSPLQRNEDVDRPGTRVVVGRGSAYDLYLTREFKAATLVRAPTSPAVTDVFLAQGLEVAAGVKQQLQADAARVGGVRLLPGRFMVIEQAMAVPKGRLAAQAWLRAFIEEMKASGFIADALQRHGIQGAAVAPRAAA